MIAVIHFSNLKGGMHEYAKLITEGYISNNINTFLYNYHGIKLDHYKQTLKLLLGIKSNVENWYYKNSIEGFEIVHFTDTSIYLGFLLNKIYNTNTKFIITIHDPVLHSRTGIVGRIHYLQAYLLNKQILKFAQQKKNVFIHLHSKNQTPKVKLNYIFSNHPISNTYMSYSEITSKTEEEIVSFLFIGTLHYYKGIDIFINSIKHFLKSVNLNAKFIIAGYGSVKIGNDLKGKIDFTNKFLSEEEFLGLIKKSHVVVFPYRDATQSGVLSLALSFNKPVIVNNVGNLGEYIKHLQTGILLEKLSTEDLVNSYVHFITTPNLISEMSKKALQFKSQFYAKETANVILSQLK